MEFDAADDLGLGREIVGDETLGAAQHQRRETRSARRLRSPSSRFFSIGARKQRLKLSSEPRKPGVRKWKSDQSSPRWFSIGVPDRQSRCRASIFHAILVICEAVVLDGVGLVEDDVVELLVQQFLRVAEEDGIGGDDEIAMPEDGIVFLPVRALEGDDAQGGGELLRLFLPVRHDALRGEDETREIGATVRLFKVQVTERLHGFAQAHVVGEDSAEALFAEERQPLESVLLVGAQAREESLRRLRTDLRLESLELLGATPQFLGREIDEGFVAPGRGPTARPDGVQAHLPLLRHRMMVEQLGEQPEDRLQFLRGNRDEGTGCPRPGWGSSGPPRARGRPATCPRVCSRGSARGTAAG